MRLVSFEHSRQADWGVVVPDGIYPLSFLYPTLAAGLAAGHDRLSAACAGPGDLIKFDQIDTFLPPVAAPNRIFCIGLNYPDHAAEANKDRADDPALQWPTVFLRHAASFVGHEEAVIKPAASGQFDYEAELAVVIGKPGRAIPRETAMAHVAGYACLAENSARDFQKHSRQVTAGKNFDRSGAIGPCIVTVDEAPDPAAMTVQGVLNGETVQHGKVAELIFPIDELIAYISRFTALQPGDIIATGTPDGVGSKRKPPRYLEVGDNFTVRIEGVGILSNRVAAEVEGALV